MPTTILLLPLFEPNKHFSNRRENLFYLIQGAVEMFYYCKTSFLIYFEEVYATGERYLLENYCHHQFWRVSTRFQSIFANIFPQRLIYSLFPGVYECIQYGAQK